MSVMSSSLRSVMEKFSSICLVLVWSRSLEKLKTREKLSLEEFLFGLMTTSLLCFLEGFEIFGFSDEGVQPILVIFRFLFVCFIF